MLGLVESWRWTGLWDRSWVSLRVEVVLLDRVFLGDQVALLEEEAISERRQALEVVVGSHPWLA